MKKLHEKPPYVHRNMTGTASGFSHSGKPTMSRNARYAQQMLRLRPSNDLHLDVHGLPNLGLPHQPTVPRQRPQTQYQQFRRHSLVKSDSQAVDSLRTSTRAGSIRSHDRSKTVDDRVLVATKELAKTPQKLEPLPKRPPSSNKTLVALEPSDKARHFHTLPPIEGEAEAESQLSAEKPPSSIEDDFKSSTESSLESEDELLSDDGSEAPPSRPGFESEAERSQQSLKIPFPTVNTSLPFQATIIQEHAQLDLSRFMAGANLSGISARVDNIVRAFRIHGPLDKQLLSQALNEVASLHPLLTAVFQCHGDKLYVQAGNKGAVKVNIESPVVGHEKPEDLVMTARRKLFHLPMSNNLVATNPDSDSDDHIPNAMSVLSVAGSELEERSPIIQLRKKVSFAQEQPLLAHQQTQQVATNASDVPQLPSLLFYSFSSSDEKEPSLLMRARLVSMGVHEHIIVLSFPRIICDFWSSCLFSKQLADAYINLEKSASYRPNLAAMRLENKRQLVTNAHERARVASKGGKMDAAVRLLQKRNQLTNQSKRSPLNPARLHFQQVAKRESQLLLMMPKEKLLEFWESMVTATIRRQRGPNRIKLVPPIRIPKGLGDKSLLMKSTTSRGTRPQTSRLRPLTASRNRPTTARRGGSGVFGDIGTSKEILMGPQTKFHFIKVEEDVCKVFCQSFPEEHLGRIRQEEILYLFSLGTYVLLLGKCCRGWGADESLVGCEKRRGDSEATTINQSRNENFGAGIIAKPSTPQRQLDTSDPLHKYKSAGDSKRQQTIIVPYGSPGRGMRRATIGGKLDLGSFLIGVEISLRNDDPNMTQGLFAPLTNDAGIRVNLSSCETFVDLMLTLERTLQLARKHGHFPFGTVAEEVGLIHGLPIKFSFFCHHDIIQLTTQDHFYFAETAIGVEGGHGLARLGTNCYLSPINSKMSDSCHVELLLWEGYEAENIAGGIRYQPQIIKTELVEAFASELLRLMAVVAEDPCASLRDIASQIHPPFISSRKNKSKRQL